METYFFFTYQIYLHSYQLRQISFEELRFNNTFTKNVVHPKFLLFQYIQLHGSVPKLPVSRTVGCCNSGSVLGTCTIPDHGLGCQQVRS